ncbi:unnamed protein product [Rhizoctonia solani]|uniref:FAD-binding PCMH-type domain-containing protein n=1 Tax=Rhizoctonia solani TaxID=456999 RepID=A0A8H2WC97_9AGAM|nr:unnamed protein product [Rhizoctonia solani]
MAQHLNASPDTTGRGLASRHKDLLGEVREQIPLIAPQLTPLLRIFDEVPKDDSRDRIAFSAILDCVKQDEHFDKILDDIVPDRLKPFIKAYAHPKQQEDHPKRILAEGLRFAPPTILKSKSVSAAAKELLVSLDHKRNGSQPGSRSFIPLPLSPHTRKMAVDIVKHLENSEEVKEGDGKPMKRLSRARFDNWGHTVTNTPSDTFVARTEEGLCNLVKWAKDNGKKVRVAGYRHTWSDFFSEDNEVLVMLLPLEYLVDIPAKEPTIRDIQEGTGSDLVGIELVTPPAGLRSNKMTYCTVKAGTTNEMFRQWCLEKRLWTLPFNVIMVEITMGGSNGPICHGAGFDTKTLSDLVVEFHYIDPNGNKKSISDPDQLKAASGCFGLLGICTAVTLRLDAMSKVVMNPAKINLPLAIPPPVNYKIPAELEYLMDGVTPQQLEQARKDFVQTCKDDYLEWFWFPTTKKVWVNTWKKVDVDVSTLETLEPYPSQLGALVQWIQTAFAQWVVSKDWFKAIPGWIQAFLLGHISLFFMPDKPNEGKGVPTLISEAIHFRRGTQNMRVWDSEWEIPIPESPTNPGERDYEKIQLAWWDAIVKTCLNPDSAMRLTLEMRLTGDSNVILAPQRHNKFGTISIEVLTIPTTPPDAWARFMQDVADSWTQYTDSKGNLLNARPHWAKQWQGLKVRGQPIEQYLKHTAYKEAIPEFRRVLENIAEAQGTTVQDMRSRFGNPLLERLIFED